MAWNSFAGSLVFAIGAGLLLPAFWLAAAPLCGTQGALSVYLVGVAVAYVAGMGRDSAQRWGVTALTGVGGLVLVSLAPSFGLLALGTGGLVASARVLLFATHPLRAIVIEATLLGTGLLAAAAVTGTRPLQVAFALTTYLLVQSAWFLIGSKPRPRATEPEDGFEQARDRLVRLLERDPV